MKRTTFRIWGSHGDFEPSLDCRFLYFGENGPDGLALKRASLADGTVVTVVGTPGEEAYGLAAIPGDPSRLVLRWQIGLGAASPYGVSVLDLNSLKEQKLDVGSSGGDGRLHVSPSGRFLATGTAAVSLPPHGPWYPSQISVFSLATGKREFVYKIPFHDEQVMVPGPNDEKSEEARVRIPDTTHVDWTSDDVLVLANRVETAFRRRDDASWTRCKATGKYVAQTGTVWRVYAGEHLRLRRTWEGQAVDLAPEALFGEGPAKVVYYNLPDYAVVVRVSGRRDGWDTVDVVVLKWRATPKL